MFFWFHWIPFNPLRIITRFYTNFRIHLLYRGLNLIFFFLNEIFPQENNIFLITNILKKYKWVVAWVKSIWVCKYLMVHAWEREKKNIYGYFWAIFSEKLGKEKKSDGSCGRTQWAKKHLFVIHPLLVTGGGRCYV